jgi:hypothetical protein
MYLLKEPYRNCIKILPINKILTVEDILKIQNNYNNLSLSLKSLDFFFYFSFWQMNQFFKNW